jgi:DNA-directed RNA polymerase subunit L
MATTTQSPQSPPPISFTFEFKDQDHTMGNLVQAELLKDPNVTFAAYNKPHPSDNKILIRVDTKSPVTPNVALHAALQRTLERLGYMRQLFHQQMSVPSSTSHQ